MQFSCKLHGFNQKEALDFIFVCAALAVGFSWEGALVLFGILSISSSDSDDSDSLNIQL